MYAKVAKYLSLALLVISVILVVLAAMSGFTGAWVDTMLRWAYLLFAAAVAIIVVLEIAISAINNPKGLIKMAVGLVIVVVIALVVYASASGKPLVNYIGEQPSAGTLKLADTMLNLVYLLAGAAVVAIVFGEIVAGARNKK